MPIGFDVTGPHAQALRSACPDPKDNLVVRAAAALRVVAERNGHAVPPVHLTLDKHLPIASGIGGGSSDAAATVEACVKLWGLPPRMDGVRDMLSYLGADVPMCLARRPLRATDRGQRLARVAIPALTIVLVNPNVAVSTAEVFARREGDFSVMPERPEGFTDETSLVRHLAETHNDLEPPARTVAPVIGDVLDRLAATPGCLLSRMSGSGATCFGIFESVEGAVTGGKAIGAERPDWWVAVTKTVKGEST